MTEKEERIARQAQEYIKKNKKKLIEKFADPNIYPSVKKPVSVFMAGSPGAGKTEVSKRFVEIFDLPTVHIDADLIREELPGYTGTNSHVVQRAASLGVEKILDSCLYNNQSFILDALFANFDKASRNIKRCLKRGRLIVIFYIYQDPLRAWQFTQKREEIEGRHISKEVFIYGFINARIVVEEIKNEYGEKVQLNVIQKDFDNGIKELWTDVQTIDKYIPTQYTASKLEELL